MKVKKKCLKIDTFFFDTEQSLRLRRLRLRRLRLRRQHLTGKRGEKGAWISQSNNHNIHGLTKKEGENCCAQISRKKFPFFSASPSPRCLIPGGTLRERWGEKGLVMVLVGRRAVGIAKKNVCEFHILDLSLFESTRKGF